MKKKNKRIVIALVVAILQSTLTVDITVVLPSSIPKNRNYQAII